MEITGIHCTGQVVRGKTSMPWFKQSIKRTRFRLFRQVNTNLSCPENQFIVASLNPAYPQDEQIQYATMFMAINQNRTEQITRDKMRTSQYLMATLREAPADA